MVRADFDGDRLASITRKTTPLGEEVAMGRQGLH